MDPKAAADVLARTLPDPKKPLTFTIADASVASGLPLRDAEAGLTWLTSEYRGHLRATEDGDLVHLFPNGFTKPWQTQETLARILSSIGGALLGAGRFIVRAWLLVVMVSYAALFVALVIGLTFARQGSSDRDDSPGFSILGGLFRALADALFWTFHPFSPLYVMPGYGYDQRDRRVAITRNAEPKVPFYEKVNRFVFGPTVPKEDEHAARSRVLREIRSARGRITLADVMRVTGLPRDKADPLMARLMLDHDGTVDVSESGGIYYTFETLRRTAADPYARGSESDGTVRPRAAWERVLELPPLTGNPLGSNIGIALLNVFNLLASAWVLRHGLTLSNIALLFDRDRPPLLPNDGVPLALGLVPFLFSLVIFALPAIRALLRTFQQKKIDAEHARLAVLREVVTRAARKEPVADETLRAAIRVANPRGDEPTSKEVTKRVVELGGDVDVGPEGEVRYRFAELEADADAVAEQRERAPEDEARLGKVVFASDD
jgi:hypothetical protein